MAITQAMCTQFKKDVMLGLHDLDSDTIKIALYTSSATLNATTDTYTTSNEVANGNGYTTGGYTLTISTNPTDGGSGTTAFLDFADATWANSTITARGALIYKVGGGNPSIAVLDFGANKSTSNSPFTIQFPTGNATSAIVRIA